MSKKNPKQLEINFVAPTTVEAPGIIIRDGRITIDWPEVLKISHSRIKLWRRCQAAHHYRYYQRLRKVRPPTPLFIGTGMHSILEAHAIRGDWKAEIAQFRKDFNKLFREEREELGDLPTEIEQIMKGYFTKYEKDGLLYVPRRGQVAEVKVQVDLDSKTRFIGFVDRFPRDAEGRNWVMDHKSCKNIPDEETRFGDLQLLMYNWLLSQMGYPKPDGNIWDYIRKKAPSVPELLVKGGLSKAAKIDTTYEVYMATVDKHGLDRSDYEEFAQTLKSKDEKFYRRIYLPAPSKGMVENVVQDVFATAKEIREAGPRAKVRNMTRDCKQCSYYSICQAEVRGLDSDYIRKTEYTIKESSDARQEKVELATGEDE